MSRTPAKCEADTQRIMDSEILLTILNMFYGFIENPDLDRIGKGGGLGLTSAL